MFRRRTDLDSAKATISVVGSLLAHVAVGLIGWGAYRSLVEKEAQGAAESQSDTPASWIAVELPSVSEGALGSDPTVVSESEAPTTYGGATVARVDTGSPGAGGETRGARATNLAAMDDGMKLDTDLISRLDRDQVQRLRTASLRTTYEDRRSTTHPMELTFLASGTGERAERRPVAKSDPSRGAMVSGAPAVVGGRPGSNAKSVEAPGAPEGATQPGQLLGSPGLGVRGGVAGNDHRTSARVTHARPLVTQAAPSIPGIWNGRPNDTVDSTQEVANAVRSLVHASVAGGLSGEGVGGSPARTSDPGAGGGPPGRGSLSRPLGSGDGEWIDWNTNDPMLLPYFRKVHAKVNPLWANAFPKSAMLELKQGTVILEFTIAADGTANVTWPPIRPSGIDEFDRNCADAIRRASPFDPLPATLTKSGRSSLKIRAPFVAKNPTIQ